MPTLSTNYSSVTDSVAITLTAAALATSATMIAGRQSTIVTNVTNKFLDAIVTGQLTTGTTPTAAKTLAVYVFVPLSVTASAFVYPKAGTTLLGETDAAATFDAEQRSGGLIFAASSANNATSDRPYSFSFSVAEVVGYMPLKWGIFVTHDTGVALNATAGNHFFHMVGIKAESA